MRTNMFNQISPAVGAFVASVLLLTLAMLSFVFLEPAVTFGATDEFTVRQEITGEISFATPASNVTMLPAIAGLTGGISSGTTTVAVSTNDPQGYTMTIQFADATAMQHETTAAYIPNFATSTPTYNFSVLTGSSSFAVAASSTSIVPALKNNGSACGAGSNISAARCWFMESNATTPRQLIDRDVPTTGGGETSIIAFRVGVGANPIPTLTLGYYTATATLTATVQ